MNNINFGLKLKKIPKIFSTNYFIRNAKGEFMCDKVDKAVWLKWMELRAYNEVNAIKTPTGLIPEYKDLKELFKTVLNKEYSEEQYIEQFTFRAEKWIEKIDRLVKQYKDTVPDSPQILFDQFAAQRKRIEEIIAKKGAAIKPADLAV